MNKVKVLIEGYAKIYDDFEDVSPSVVLIENEKHKIIIDPGFNRDNLLKILDKEGLKTENIDVVFLTHYHMDHSLLAGMFEKAIFMDNGDQYSQNGIIKRQEDKMLGEGIEIIQTPGHDPFHCSVVVDTEDMGKIVIAGDIFWWVDGEEPKKDFESLINLEDPYVKDENALKESRKKILEIVDWIIPGHGKMFKNLNKK
ncbi:MAG: MBL fold metallo-hydrolase [Candidatus Shapirobacteria bacterium]|nr:MBL fold metallo-hydrolase [Candidatus Shapirobacteria bacterium]